MRWTEFVAFSPLMQMHRQIAENMQNPWSYGGDALTNFASYTRLRISRFLYLYTMAQQARCQRDYFFF